MCSSDLVRKLQCPPGYKAIDGKCVKMSAEELLKRKRAAKVIQRKLRADTGKREKMLRKRVKSLRIRASRIPDNASTPGQQTNLEKK